MWEFAAASLSPVNRTYRYLAFELLDEQNQQFEGDNFGAI